MRAVSEAEKRMRRVENTMIGHINGLSSPLGAPVEVYADTPVVKRGKPTGEMRRCPFINPEPGVYLTHVLNLDKVRVEVHHRDDTARYTDFALVFQPLQLLAKQDSSSRGEAFHGGPYTVRVEFKTSDSSVLFDVRVADRNGEVDSRAIPDPPDPELEGGRRRPSATQFLGGLLRRAATSTVKSADRVAKGVRNFHELQEDEDGDVACHNHDCVQALKVMLTEQVAAPVEEIFKLDMQFHEGKGY
mmetsp:Transcript_129608/g.276422  ORF Transcript_129608/g.276422 Transcript_129608/m.276422 type:complete len:245 (+) Transcript_129608:84-818(+)